MHSLWLQTPKKHGARAAIFGKNYIQLETNTLLLDFVEPLPTISYRRKKPFVVTTQNLRKSPGF